MAGRHAAGRQPALGVEQLPRDYLDASSNCQNNRPDDLFQNDHSLWRPSKCHYDVGLNFSIPTPVSDKGRDPNNA